MYGFKNEARKEVTDGLISDLLEASFNRVVMISKLQGVEEWIDIEEMEKVTINYSFELFFDKRKENRLQQVKGRWCLNGVSMFIGYRERVKMQSEILKIQERYNHWHNKMFIDNNKNGTQEQGIALEKEDVYGLLWNKGRGYSK